MSTREELTRDQKRFAVWVFIAATAHAALVVLSFLMQLYYLRTHPPVKIVTVSLVTLPGTPGPAGGPAVPEQPPAPKPVAEVPAPKPLEPPAPKKIPEPAPAKKIVPEEKPKSDKADLADALSRLKKQTESREAGKGISSSLASLQKKVASQGKGPAQGSGSGGGGGLYGQGGGASDPYKSKIAGIIQNNWTFSEQMLRTTRGMEVYVAINILPNGTISQIRFDQRASSEYLNNSVKVALQKSSPLPALPREYGSKPYWIGFVFTPEGVTK